MCWHLICYIAIQQPYWNIGTYLDNYFFYSAKYSTLILQSAKYSTLILQSREKHDDFLVVCNRSWMDKHVRIVSSAFFAKIVVHPQSFSASISQINTSL